MGATRSLLTFQYCFCLLVVSILSCKSVCASCTGKNGCQDNGVQEPNLPPRDNECCSSSCPTTPVNPPESGPCNNTKIWRCLLDTHCGMGNVSKPPFTYNYMSDCELQQENAARLAAGYARYLSFQWNNATCQAQNTKCGINCCCRKNCPELFC